jgi:hypothetical protein
MRCARIITVFSLTAFFVMLTTMAFSQDKKAAATDKPVTVGEILKTAKCPLTTDQAKQLKELKPGMERSALAPIYQMFDEKQITALKEALGSQPGRNGGADRPRNLIQTIMFENAGCPFTESQIVKIKEIAPGQGSREAMMAFLTDRQKETMQGMFKPAN